MLMPQSEYVTKLVSNLGHEGTGIGMEMEIGWRWKSSGDGNRVARTACAVPITSR
jgi:hypothetical protein